MNAFEKWARKNYASPSLLAGALRQNGIYTTRQGVHTWFHGTVPELKVVIALDQMGFPKEGWLENPPRIVRKNSSRVSKKIGTTDNGAPTSESDASQTNGEK